MRLVDLAEYKRRQYPPGPKITPKGFGRDRRLPITNRWREPLGVKVKGSSIRGRIALAPLGLPVPVCRGRTEGLVWHVHDIQGNG